MSDELICVIVIGFLIGVTLSAFNISVNDMDFWFWCIPLNILNALVSKKIFGKSEK